MQRLSALICLLAAACSGAPESTETVFGQPAGLAAATAEATAAPPAAPGAEPGASGSGPAVAGDAEGLTAMATLPGSRAAATSATPPGTTAATLATAAAVPGAAAPRPDRSAQPSRGSPAEGALRAALATTAEPREPALRLVQLLQEEERLPEAEALLRNVLGRPDHDDAVLRVALAGVLRGLGRPGEAVVELQHAVDAPGGMVVQPALLLELAELHAFAGDRERAQATLELVRQAHADAAWLQANTAAVEELDRDLRRGVRPRPRVIDLLGVLRTNPSALRRLDCLEALLAVSPEVAAVALAIAARDADETVRATVVRRAVVAADDLPEWCATAMVDRHPLVRQAGAVRAQKLDPATAASFLVPALAIEEDPETFRAIHRTLAASRPGPELGAVEARDPAVRAAIVAGWRQQWQ